MKKYVYNGIEYASAHNVRQEIWKAECKIFGEPQTTEDWAKLGVVYTETDAQLTQEQLSQQIRTKRDRLLEVSDYYVMPDYPSTEEGLTKVKVYRQALRDITKQEGFPLSVKWPFVPDALS